MRSKLYRLLMRVSHRYNWHYAPAYQNGEMWCAWCGLKGKGDDKCKH